MAITPAPGYIVDPNNPNGVIRDPKAQFNAFGTQVNPAGTPVPPPTTAIAPTTYTPTATPPSQPVSQYAPPSTTTSGTPTSVPTASTPLTPEDQKLASLGLSADQIASVKAGNMDPGSFQNLIGQVETRLKLNNDLVTQRGYLMKHLYDSPLTPEEKQKLPPEIVKVVDTGDKDAVELQLRLLNDQISGRGNTLTQSIQTLTTGYQTAVNDATDKRQAAIDNLIKFAQTYGSKAPSVLKNLYGQQYVDQLKALGIDINNLGDTPTIAEQRYAAQYGIPAGALNVDIPSGTIASKTNNPLNIKFSSLTSGFGGTDSGIKGQDGGTFASFSSPQAGLDAAVKLLQSPLYDSLTVDQAMKQWSNSGYGGEVAPELDKTQKISSLSPDQMDQLVSDMATRESGSTISASTGMVQEIAKGIESGISPPTLTGLYGKSGAVRAQLASDGYDLVKATEDWNAVTKWTNTVDSATFQRAIVASDSAKQYITSLRDLSSQWKRSDYPILNAANLKAAQQGLYGTDAQAISQKFTTQIADLEADMASVYRYGLSSTDSSMENAGRTLSTDWSETQLNASLDVIENNLSVRINSLKNPQNALSAGGGTNPYVGGGTDTATPPPSGSTDYTSILDGLMTAQ